jgi:hypothetical protein
VKQRTSPANPRSFAAETLVGVKARHTSREMRPPAILSQRQVSTVFSNSRRMSLSHGRKSAHDNLFRVVSFFS